MSVVAAPRASEQQRYTHWDRARLSVVVPIGVIVAVAHERQLFSGALTNYGLRVLREVDSVASSQSATQNIRRKFDPVWTDQRAGAWLAVPCWARRLPPRRG